jgi:hypothetical protein
MGSGKAGATEGAEVDANWINAQMGQSKSADPSGLWIGLCVRSAAALEESATANALAEADGSP